MSRGPYVTEDCSEIMIPVGIPWNEARHEAAELAQEMIPVWGRTRYTGVQSRSLHDHDDWWACSSCHPQHAWCFDVYEGTPRW